MKKIMKRLLTGVLTLATVFTALPVVTQVHAADSVYTLRTVKQEQSSRLTMVVQRFPALKKA